MRAVIASHIESRREHREPVPPQCNATVVDIAATG